VVGSGGRQDKLEKYWRKGSLEQKLGAAAGSPARCSPCKLLLWQDLGVLEATPHAEEGSCGLCQALSRRDAAMVWASQPILASLQALFFFLPSGEDKAGSSLCAPGWVVSSRTIPLVRHQIPACEPSISLTKSPRENLLDWKKDINLKSVQQSNCRVFPPLPEPERARES